MVIDESLRLNPPVSRFDREANKDFEFEGLKVKKGQVFEIPTYPLHHDPDIYPNPDVFDPERFSDENKKTRDSAAFIPFGIGPRSCIGMRFALIEIKLFLSSILLKYRFVPCEKTPVSNFSYFQVIYKNSNLFFFFIICYFLRKRLF